MAANVFLVFVSFFNCLQCLSQCATIGFAEGVVKKLITEDLFATSIDSSSMTCPFHSIGNSALCGQNRHAREDEFKTDLPDGLIFSTFFEPQQYALCKAKFQDPAFLDGLKNVPEPSQEAIKWFEWRNIAHTSLIPSMDSDPEFVNFKFSDLDYVQRKMVTVFYNVKSWTFCPERIEDDGWVVHGVCDRENNIVIYNTACRVGKVYDAEVASSALLFRIFFVCAHELGHVIDKLNGKLDFSDTDGSEGRANIYGLVVTQAFSTLVTRSLEVWSKVVKDSQHLAAPCDALFIERTLQKWNKMPQYFGDRIRIAKSILTRGQSGRAALRRNRDWTIWACLEKVK